MLLTGISLLKPCFMICSNLDIPGIADKVKFTHVTSQKNSRPVQVPKLSLAKVKQITQLFYIREYFFLVCTKYWLGVTGVLLCFITTVQYSIEWMLCESGKSSHILKKLPYNQKYTVPVNTKIWLNWNLFNLMFSYFYSYSQRWKNTKYGSKTTQLCINVLKIGLFKYLTMTYFLFLPFLMLSNITHPWKWYRAM